MSKKNEIPEWEKELKEWAEKIRPKFEKKEEPQEIDNKDIEKFFKSYKEDYQ